MIYSIRSKIVLFATCAALPVTGLLAQEPATTSTPSVSVPAGTETPAAGTAPGKHGHGGGLREKFAALTPAEKTQFKAAHDKAMQDPAVKTAEATKETDRKGFRKTVVEAMLRADPSIKPILEKMHGEGKPGKLND